MRKFIGLIAMLVVLTTSAMAVEVSVGDSAENKTVKVGVYTVNNFGVTADITNKGDVVAVDLIKNFGVPVPGSEVLPYVGGAIGLTQPDGIDFKGDKTKGQYGWQFGVTVPTNIGVTPYIECQQRWLMESGKVGRGDTTVYAGVRLVL